ncbi:MAG: glycosyl transferase [Eubacteriales bacterium]
MKFGFFDDGKKEYVIETPHTPLPWINYLGNESFFGLISNTGGGYCFYRDAKLLRLLRYRYNNVPADIGGRFYYIKEDNGSSWSPAFHPVDTPLDTYRCRHGLGYTVFESEKDGLAADLTCFVPIGEACEVHRLTLTNKTNQAKNVQLYGAVEWCLWNAVDDAVNFQRNLNIGEVEVEGSTVFHKTEYRERRNHYAYYSVNQPLSHFDTARDAFLGAGRGWDSPIALENGQCSGSIAHGWSPVAALQNNFSLGPNEEKTFIYILGYGENPNDDKFISPGVIKKDTALRVNKKFSTPESVEMALNDLADYWNNLLGCYTLKSEDDTLNRMVNIWHQYQCMTTFNLSRSASYFESGTGRGMGFRDSCQDILGFVHLIPERARERIIDIASVQWEDGSTYHQYQPLTKRGNNDVGSGFNDDPLWLVACTHAYVAETGDTSILDELVPFDHIPGSEKPLMEHLRRSIRFTLDNRGPHGLPKIGRADWNDCLNLNSFSTEPGESFQTCGTTESDAESIFIAGMFVLYGKKYAELCTLQGLTSEADTTLAAVDAMSEAVKKHGWDGEWFLRAYDAYGNVVGSHTCDEGQIFIEPQGFCVMAGIGVDDGKAKTAVDSAKDRLLGEFGMELLAPCYTRYHEELGEITSYPPGYKENGSIFSHNNPWVSIAETVLGRGDSAFDLYRRVSPAFIEDKSDIRRSEPYVYAQTIAARESSSEGEAKNSWLTGTGSWAFVNISQAILGVIPTVDGLCIKPCLPGHLNDYTVDRKFRGTTYHIHIKQTGSYSLTVDGKAIEGNVIPPDNQRTECQVEVTV